MKYSKDFIDFLCDNSEDFETKGSKFFIYYLGKRFLMFGRKWETMIKPILLQSAIDGHNCQFGECVIQPLGQGFKFNAFFDKKIYVSNMYEADFKSTIEAKESILKIVMEDGVKCVEKIRAEHES